ncbi:GIY-YIG nuclease family protein [Chitinophaga sp. HK235]|uniref:GIY-YIG nuclease family protein n=1 Tax=Chitinophaga sp. HK235 TaxID=2952571 RepID=UPI001BA4FC3A|nr:GIY-YIG nuclease family protein [Chitinophaga sp. HK235]
MVYYVYILQSLVDGSFYKGFTQDYHERLRQHSAGDTKSTANKRPWKLIYVEQFYSKREALIREKKALLDLIVDIIVKATLKEYYETNNCLENEQE